jgi:hypothetical protein
VGHLRLVADPDRAEHRHQRRGLWLASTWEGMVAVNGLLEPEAGQTLVAALPQTGGVRPQLLVTVDLDSLLGPGGPGGAAPWPPRPAGAGL